MAWEYGRVYIAGDPQLDRNRTDMEDNVVNSDRVDPISAITV